MPLLDEFSIPNIRERFCEDTLTEAELREVTQACEILSKYTYALLCSLQNRAEGQFEWERNCGRNAERYYATLPDSWKW